MAAVHPTQESLPAGWECHFDPRTGRHYFLNHLEHITTWEDPRLRPSPLQQTYAPYYSPTHYSMTVTSPPPPPPPPSSTPPPLEKYMLNGSNGYKYEGYYAHRFYTHSGGFSPNYGSPKTPYRFKSDNSVQVDDQILMKLCLQFPTVEEARIWQLLKQYHNRENVVVSALLSDGKPRAETLSMEISPKLQKSDIFQNDEVMFHKLRNFFPAVDPEHIRNLQRLYDNQEHEVIGALVSGNRGYNSRHQSPHPSSPKMKLRYLKLVFPECDEAILFDVLNNCDNNAQEATSRLVGMGYPKRDTPVSRPNSGQPRKPSLEFSHLSPTPEHRRIVYPNVSDKLQLLSRLQDQFPAVSRTLVNMALDSSNFDEDRAKQFLTAMTPQDRTKVSLTEIDAKSKFPADTPPIPPPRSRHGSASSDKGSLEKLSRRGDSPSKSPSHYATTRSPAHKEASQVDYKARPKFKTDTVKTSKTTSTQVDIEEENVSAYRTRAKGPDPTLRKGPSITRLIKQYLPWRGPDKKNCKGANTSLHRGPDPNNRVGSVGAKGPQRSFLRNPFKSSKQQIPTEG